MEARGVHEHDVERGQKVAPTGEQRLLQDVLHAARRKRRRGVLLILGKLLAEPRHGPIEMMQFQAVDAVDAIILAPAVGGAVRAAAEQAVQHGQERRALQRELMVARSPDARSRLGSPSPPKTRSKASAGPTRRVAIVVASPRSSASSTIALSAKRAPERKSRSSCRSP
jgi:hypothetical protein